MPFGPEISWPHGFRPLDAESRDLLESAYRTGAVYQQPAVDDYGDPGYSHPSYDGPRAQYGSHPGPQVPRGAPAFPGPYGAPAFPGPYGGSRTTGPRESGGTAFRPSGAEVPGYHVQEDQGSSWAGRASRPATGDQKVLRDTGPQPAPGRRGSGGLPQAGSAAYPEQWYDHPRLDERALGDHALDTPWAPGAPPGDHPRSGTSGAGSAPADPRLAGISYDELRYDDDLDPGEPGYDEPLDDESWYQELRRSAPAYPQGFGPEHPSGPQRRAEPRASGRGHHADYRQADYPQAPDRPPGYGPPRGGSMPQMSAGQPTRPGPRDAAAPDPGNLLSAPAGRPGVGVLTPPGGIRVSTLQDAGTLTAPGTGAVARHGTGAFPAASQILAPPSTERPQGTTVRPGHGLDGPEITASWPAQPSADELDAYEEFWREDDEDAEYTGLFGDSGAASVRSGAAKRRTGRRRGRSNDKRLWLGLGGVAVVTAAAITGVIKFEFPSHSGPAHTMATPDQIGTYARTVDLEHQADVAALRADVIKMSAGKASRVVSAVYESGNSAAGGTEQIIMFLGGHLANADPGASVASFTQKFAGAQVVSAGSLGGRAACVETGDNVALCAWFDNDSFGEVVSPTMNASDLDAAMQTVRPAVEHLARN